MKKRILLLTSLCVFTTSIAFPATYDTLDVSPFKLAAETQFRVSELDRLDTDYDIFAVNLSSLKQITRSAQETMIMKIPGRTPERDLDLELVKADIFTPDFRLTLASGAVAEYVDLGTHYRGIIKGDERSVVAISVYEHEVMGLISSDAGNLVLGKLKGHDWNGEHVLYNDRNLLKDIGFDCGTVDDGIGYTKEELKFNGTGRAIGDCIRFYIEVDYNLYVFNGGLVGVTNYVTGLLNNVITLYNNENIATTVSEIMIWDVPSPYTGTSSSSMLSEFQQNTDVINGDLGQLLSASGGGGIAAGFAGICNANVDNSLCFSDVNAVVNPVPIYSWSVYVVTHEFGHLFGSRHTHACVWNGDNTAIDGCAGYTEGNGPFSCPVPGIPPEGGTIMSYCHQTGVGIDFNLGFGPQPGNVIRYNVFNATCTSPCGPATCTDNIHNGQETGVDCGGPDCDPCPCEPVTDEFPVNPLTHSGPGSGSAILNYGSPFHEDVSFTISDINAKLNGNPSRHYIEEVTVTYNDGTSTQTYGTYYGDQQSSASVSISGTVYWVNVSLADGYDDGITNSTMSITFSGVSSCGDGNGGGGCPDSDGDGVCDADDICPGYDDNTDSDGDGIPDGCDNCTSVSNVFPDDPLTHAGTGSSSTSYDFGTPGHTEVSFVVTDLGAKINGNPNNRYIDLVTVTYTDAGGSHTYGTFSGENTGSANVDLAGPVNTVTVTLEDGYDGNPPGTLSVDPGTISSCPPAGNLPGIDDPGPDWVESNISDLSVYPNPAGDRVTFRLRGIEDAATLTIYDHLGRTVWTTQVEAGRYTLQLDLDNNVFHDGIYLVSLVSQGERITKHMVVMK